MSSQAVQSASASESVDVQTSISPTAGVGNLDSRASLSTAASGSTLQPSSSAPAPPLTRSPITPPPSAAIRNTNTSAWGLPPGSQETRTNTLNAGAPRPRQVTGGRTRSVIARLKHFLGYGNNASRKRKADVNLIWDVSWGLIQIVAIITILSIAATKKSHVHPRLNEWQACDRPLGIWACLWLARVLLACGLSCWGWRREMTRIKNDTTRASLMLGTNNRASLRGQPPRLVASTPAPDNTQPGTTGPEDESDDQAEEIILPHNQLYARLTLLSSMITLTWFLTAHILEYSSVNTCRLASPHIWWLTFAILCIMYIMVLEVLFLGIVVFVIAPIIFITYNILLILLGRHPMLHPTAINPEVGKLPRALVNRIPLVYYIPPPPEDFGENNKNDFPISVPQSVHVYPPGPLSINAKAPKRLFKFFRSSKDRKKANAQASKGASAGGEGAKHTSGQGNGDDDVEKAVGGNRQRTWEENWEQGEYPFVRLENNRAACAICLMDFEEPKRVAGMEVTMTDDQNKRNTSASEQVQEGQGQQGTLEVEEVPNGPEENGAVVQGPQGEELKLTDAGDGAQPLRLLDCGHVFHKSCLDPWLCDVSGRCPVCQKPVVLPEPHQKKRSWRRTRTRQQHS